MSEAWFWVWLVGFFVSGWVAAAWILTDEGPPAGFEGYAFIALLAATLALIWPAWLGLLAVGAVVVGPPMVMARLVDRRRGRRERARVEADRRNREMRARIRELEQEVFDES